MSACGQEVYFVERNTCGREDAIHTPPAHAPGRLGCTCTLYARDHGGFGCGARRGERERTVWSTQYCSIVGWA